MLFSILILGLVFSDCVVFYGHTKLGLMHIMIKNAQFFIYHGQRKSEVFKYNTLDIYIAKIMLHILLKKFIM